MVSRMDLIELGSARKVIIKLSRRIMAKRAFCDTFLHLEYSMVRYGLDINS